MHTEDLHKALGAFFICFGQELPPHVKDRIRQRCHLTADLMARAGDTSVAKLTRGLGDALATESVPKKD